ncbi:MAG: SH3 domain-containing protein, partial [Chloroflexota bacterium]
TLDHQPYSVQVSSHSLAFSSDGKMLVVGYDDASIVMWSLTGASAPAMGDTTTTAATPAGDSTGSSSTACTITAPQTANLRGGPGTSFAKAGSLNAGETASVNGQAQSSDGKTWYRTTANTWVRSDLVTAPAECDSVPTVTP